MAQILKSSLDQQTSFAEWGHSNSRRVLVDNGAHTIKCSLASD